MSEFRRTQTHFPFFRERMLRQRLFHCLCGSIFEFFPAAKSPNVKA